MISAGEVISHSCGRTEDMARFIVSYQGLAALNTSISFTLPWPIAVLLFAIVLVASYLAALPLLAPRDRRANLAEAIAASGFGLVCLGFLLLVMRWTGLPAHLSSFALFAAAVVTAGRRRSAAIPKLGDGSKLSLLPVSAAVAFVLPCAIGGWLMGTGDYPEVFFHAGTPFRLIHTYQFIEDRGMPPLSLSNLGIRLGYHYTAPAAASAVSLISGLAPAPSFMLTLATGIMGILGVSALLADAVGGRLRFGIRFAVILAAAPLTAWSAGRAVEDWISDPQLFFNHFPDISVNFGVFLFLLILYGCFDLRNQRRMLLALLATILVAGVKSSYYPTAGLLLFSAALVQIYRTRDFRWLLLPAVAFVCGTAIMQTTGHAITGSLAIEPLFLFNNFPKKSVKYVLDIALFLAPLAVYARLTGGWKKLSAENKSHLVMLGLALAGLYGFLNLFGHYMTYPDGIYGPDTNVLVPLRLTPKLLAVAAVLALTILWDVTRKRLNTAVLIYLSLIFVLPLAHKATHALIYLIRPELGHEYVDNRPIAEALAKIPLSGSVIVTNDLRYPANDFKRDQRQMQIPALFGHQAYAVNISFEPYPDSGKRIEEQKNFAEPDWKPGLVDIARDRGWTHLLVHKLAPHPKEIPLDKLFENERYAVYGFE